MVSCAKRSKNLESYVIQVVLVMRPKREGTKDEKKIATENINHQIMTEKKNEIVIIVIEIDAVTVKVDTEVIEETMKVVTGVRDVEEKKNGKM